MTNTGLLINQGDSLDKLEYLVGDARKRSKSSLWGKSSHGLNFEPTILRDMTREMDAHEHGTLWTCGVSL